MNDDLELKRKSTCCLMWLAENLPMFAVWETKESAVLWAAFDDLIQDIIPITSHDEGCRVAGTLHDLIISVFPGQDRQNRRQELLDIAAGRPSGADELLPLHSLWAGFIRSGRFSYSDQLVGKPFAAEICSCLIYSSFGCDDPDLACRLLGHASRDWQLRTDNDLVFNDFLHDRYFGFRQPVSKLCLNPIFCSWQGSRECDESHIMHNLAAIRVPKPSLPDAFGQQLLALSEAREVWRGLQAVDKIGKLLPLHFLLPNSAFLSMWATSQLWTTPLITDPTSPLRLMCLRRSTQAHVSRMLPFRLGYEQELVAMFDLSIAATAALLSQSQWWTSHYLDNDIFSIAHNPEMTWVGTAAEYSSCLQLILDDIWADRDQQLDAWQQLYALACVKLCFKHMWKIGDEARVAKWMESSYPNFDSASVIEGSSDDGLESEKDQL
jgi:hypothetical protein